MFEKASATAAGGRNTACRPSDITKLSELTTLLTHLAECSLIKALHLFLVRRL